MNEVQLADSAYNMWAARGLDGTSNEVKDLLKSMVQDTVDKVVATSPEFIFAIENDTYTFTSSDSNTVELFGKNSEARDIYTVLWGSKNKLLRKYGEYEKDVSFSNSTITGEQFGWVNRGYGSSGYPKIEILGDAVAAGDTITYRYLRNDITIQEFPTQWGFVVRDVLLGDARPSHFSFKARESLQKMIDFFTTPRKGGETSLPDPDIASSNYRRFVNLNVG